ncbi:MAG: beta strand repeat-containing protein, partial [Afipia sp.]
MSDPITSLHYTPNANIVSGQYVPASDGFNLADVSSVAELNSLPPGVKGLVWLNMGDGVTASFQSVVSQYIGNPNLYGFYLKDEPDPSLVAAANLKAESDWIHANVPGAKTFIVLLNVGTPTNPSYINTYNSANTDIDLFGLDPYPVRPQFNGANYSVIPAAVSAAEAAGIKQSQIVPVYQAFGGGGFPTYTLPTASQEQQVLSTWGSVVPAPAFDFAFSWGSQLGDSSLNSSPALQQVFAAHNTPTSSTSAVTSIIDAPAAGVRNIGNTVTITVNFSGTVIVSGTPTLGLNDNGTATYTSGSGTNALIFSYRVSSNDTNVSSLAATSVNLNGATITDVNGLTANLSFYGLTQTGPQIVTAIPAVETQFSGISNTSTYPPHNGLAAGPSNIVMAEGSRIEWTNLTGGAATLQSVYQFFKPLGSVATNALSYSRCAYDSVNQRYIVTINNTASGGTISNIDIAVSKDSNPNDGWYFASLNTSLTINNQLTSSNQPVVSVDGANIYITDAQYNVNGSGFAGTECWIIGDTAGVGGGIYNGGALTVTANQLVPPDHGIYRVIAGNNGTSYYASTSSTGVETVVALQTYNAATNTFGPLSTLALGNSDQGNGNTSFTAQQQGTNLLLDAGSTQIRSMAYANGFLYGVSEVKPVGSSVPEVHWFKLDVTNPSAPTLVAQGDLSGATIGANVATFDASIALDAAGDVIINFAASGPNMYPADYFVYDRATDLTYTFSAPVLYQASTSYFNSGDGASTQRWGNDSSAIADPKSPNAFWISGEYVANAWWQTSVAQVAIQPVAATTAPTVLSIVTSGMGITNGGGDLNAGKVITLTVNFNEAVTVNVAGGMPTLTPNDGGAATYTGGSATSALTFSYTVQPGQNTSDLVVSSFNLNGATIQDAAGNSADLSGATNYNPAGTLQIDTTAPAAPTGLSLDTTTDSGTKGDGITNFTQVKIDGTAEPGSTVTLYDTNGTTVLGSGIADATTGVFGITTSTLSSGTHSITAKATDAAGNIGVASAAYAVTVTSTAPPAPTGLSLDTTTDSGTQGDGITNFAQLKIDGTASAGNTVTLYDSNGTTVIGTGMADATTGAFGITTSTLSNGTHSITAKATDSTGNSSALSTAYAVTVDTTAPAAPTGLSLDTTTDSGTKGDGITSFTQVKIDGTAEPGSTVTLYDTNSTTVLGTNAADATTGVFTITTASLSTGTHNITAKATDAAGNIGTASTAYSVTIDTTAPAAPTGLSLDTTTDSGTKGDGITSFTQVKIDGTAEPGSTVTLYDTN